MHHLRELNRERHLFIAVCKLLPVYQFDQNASVVPVSIDT